MKRRRLLVMVVLIALGIVELPAAHAAGLEDLLKDVKRAIGLDQRLSMSKIIEGLKEALKISSSNAVKAVSKVGGYYDNPKIKIPLPGAIKKVEKLLRATGFGPKLDAFELSLNRAAEQAAPEAKAIVWDAIKQMSFTDARKILNGRDNEATLYFKDKTWDPLHETFKPIAHKAMSRVGVTRKYQELEDKLRSMPFSGILKFDLDDYVTNGALEGLFTMLAEEEKKIRQDPAARVTDLLKEVFGNK